MVSTAAGDAIKWPPYRYTIVMPNVNIVGADGKYLD